jgi:FAD/FMN-containing dehydrogenase
MNCRAMADTLKPRDAKEVEEAVRWALGNEKPLEIAGHGTKRTIGRPSQTDLTLDLSGLAGVTLYEPAELVLSARAGTPLPEIEALLEKNNQELAFEPIDYGPVLGSEVNRGTLGGAIAANLSGPRRIKAGAARDHFLGVTAVTGRGETIKSGGRVVKNVTGYDLCKLLAGSWGTLAAMTDITIKVLPKAETEATVLVQVSTMRAPVLPWLLRWAHHATCPAPRICPITLHPGLTDCPGPRLRLSCDWRASRRPSRAAKKHCPRCSRNLARCHSLTKVSRASCGGASAT